MVINRPLLLVGGSSPHISIARLDGPERVANVPRLGHGYAFPMHEAGSTPALGFQGDYFIFVC